LADWGQRFLAVVIDWLIIGAVELILVGPIYLVTLATVLNRVSRVSTTTAVDGHTTVTASPGAGSVFAVLALVWLAIFVIILGIRYLYDVEFALRRGGQTIGKRVMKITVTPIAPGQSLSRGHLALRFLAWFGMGIVPFLGLVDILFPLFDKPYQQALHDKAAKTVVVRLSA